METEKIEGNKVLDRAEEAMKKVMETREANEKSNKQPEQKVEKENAQKPEEKKTETKETEPVEKVDEPVQEKPDIALDKSWAALMAKDREVQKTKKEAQELLKEADKVREWKELEELKKTDKLEYYKRVAPYDDYTDMMAGTKPAAAPDEKNDQIGKVKKETDEKIDQIRNDMSEKYYSELDAKAKEGIVGEIEKLKDKYPATHYALGRDGVLDEIQNYILNNPVDKDGQMYVMTVEEAVKVYEPVFMTEIEKHAKWFGGLSKPDGQVNGKDKVAKVDEDEDVKKTEMTLTNTDASQPLAESNKELSREDRFNKALRILSKR
ncbi:MAG: hypothetical protein GY861_01075 [bacterium]|nr:hypothetical protein [bacterium]